MPYGPDTRQRISRPSRLRRSHPHRQNAADLPVQAPTEYELVFNLRTLKGRPLKHAQETFVDSLAQAPIPHFRRSRWNRGRLSAPGHRELENIRARWLWQRMFCSGWPDSRASLHADCCKVCRFRTCEGRGSSRFILQDRCLTWRCGEDPDASVTRLDENRRCSKFKNGSAVTFFRAGPCRVSLL